MRRAQLPQGSPGGVAQCRGLCSPPQQVTKLGLRCVGNWVFCRFSENLTAEIGGATAQQIAGDTEMMLSQGSEMKTTPTPETSDSSLVLGGPL